MKKLFENNNFFVINKPAGVLSESLYHKLTHRLDKDTSGLIVIAKNQEYREKLQELFKERKVKKKYIALVHGKTPEKGEISLAISRQKGLKRKTSLIGRQAITEYKVKKYYDKYSLLEVFPKTGRTHQIRVHLKAIGHPIVGDKFYKFKRKDNLNLKRQFLHAKEISFLDFKFKAPLAKDLQDVLFELE